jgi:hypothetical protein
MPLDVTSILIAVIMLAVITNGGTRLVKRKAAEKKWAAAYNENQQMNEFVGDPERVKRWKATQLKCQYFARAYIDDKSSPVPEIANKADEMLEDIIRKVLTEAAAIKNDEYCRSLTPSRNVCARSVNLIGLPK